VYATRKVHGAAARAYNRNLTFPKIELSERNAVLLAAIHKDLADFDDSEMPREILLDSQPPNPMSQLDMAIALSVIYLFLVFSPQLCGVREDPEGLRAYIHVWALTGKLLGLEDRFNPALHHDDGVTARKMMDNCIIGTFKNSDEYAMTIWDTTLSSIRFLSLFRTPIFLCVLVQGLVPKEGHEAKKVYATLTTFEKFLLKLFTALRATTVSVWVIYVSMNFLVRRFLTIFIKIYVWKYGSTTASAAKKVTV
jgi:hypothetical protein